MLSISSHSHMFLIHIVDNSIVLIDCLLFQLDNQCIVFHQMNMFQMDKRDNSSLMDNIHSCTLNKHQLIYYMEQHNLNHMICKMIVQLYLDMTDQDMLCILMLCMCLNMFPFHIEYMLFLFCNILCCIVCILLFDNRMFSQLMNPNDMMKNKKNMMMFLSN